MSTVIRVDELKKQYNLVRQRAEFVMQMYRLYELLSALYKDYKIIYMKDPKAAKKPGFKRSFTQLAALVKNQKEVISILNKDGISVKLLKPLSQSLLIVGVTSGFARLSFA